MALSNKFGWLVLTTGNKSEMAVGYSTLYGDTAGGFAVIKDVLKTLVYELCRVPQRAAGRELIPDDVLTKPPSAELRPDQRDDQSLPPYEVLDPILEAYVEDDRTAAELDRGRASTPGSCDASRGSSTSPSTSAASRPPGVRVTPRRSARTAASRSRTATAADHVSARTERACRARRPRRRRVLFGTTFVVVKDALDRRRPMPFLAVRFLIGALALAAVRPPPAVTTRMSSRAGLSRGAALLVGLLLQTVGLQYTTSSTSAFITYLLVVVRPLCRSPSARARPSTLAVVGSCSPSSGCLLTGGVDRSARASCSRSSARVAFAVHIVLLGRAGPRYDTVRLNASQLAAVGDPCLVPGRSPAATASTAAPGWRRVLAGVVASAVALVCMAWAQRRVVPDARPR